MTPFSLAASEPWAITRDALKVIAEIANREHDEVAGKIEALQLRAGKEVDRRGIVRRHGNVDVIGLNGPVFRRANLFTEISGATSTEQLAQAFQASVEDPAVQAIVLEVDSPGGQVPGISEFASAVYAARDTKPVVAYVDGDAASAAYWIASGASRIVASDTSMVGSIGVVTTIVTRESKDGAKVYEFVSSQSPKKRLDLETDEGQAEVQKIANDVAQVFVESVARNRGVETDKVLSDFGRGGVLIASEAREAGMIDAVGTLEDVLAELNGGNARITGGAMSTPSAVDAAKYTEEQLQAKVQEAVNAAISTAKTEAIAGERTRIAAILDHEEAADRGVLARHLALATDNSVEAASGLLKVAAKETASEAKNPLGTLLADSNPDVSPTGGKAGEGEEQTVEAMIAETLKISGDIPKEVN